jgi:hypothetical protein
MRFHCAAGDRSKRPFDSCFERKRENQKKKECDCTNESAVAANMALIIRFLEADRFLEGGAADPAEIGGSTADYSDDTD